MGVIVVLNGVPRSGKSTLAQALLERTGWVGLGVDQMNASLSPDLLPGIGLRPGGERPDLEPWVPRLFRSLYQSALAYQREGLNVVMDVGHHGSFATIPNPLFECARFVTGVPAYLIGVRCPIEEIRRRREATGMAVSEEILHRWEAAIHDPGLYDLEVDTSVMDPAFAAQMIRERLESHPEAFLLLVQAKMSS